MPETPNPDLKTGAEQTPDSNGHESKQNPVEPKELDDLEKDIDNLIKDDDDDGEEDDDDSDDGETVVLSKSEVAKLKRDNQNYKKGLLSTKDKLKGLKSRFAVTQPQSQPEKKADDPNAPLTKAEYAQQKAADNEREAQQQFEDESEIFSEHREGIMEFYTPRRGNKTVKDALEDLRDAEAIFLKRNPDFASGDGEDKHAKSDLASGAKPSGSSKGSGKKGETKRVIPKSESPKNWY